MPARSGWANAESTLTELLVRAFPASSVLEELTFDKHQVLEPSTTLWRRQIKLIVARKGGDGEVVAGAAALDYPQL